MQDVCFTLGETKQRAPGKPFFNETLV